MDKYCLVRNEVRVGNIYKYQDGSLWEIIGITQYEVSSNYWIFNCFKEGLQAKAGQTSHQNQKSLAMTGWTKMGLMKKEELIAV